MKIMILLITMLILCRYESNFKIDGKYRTIDTTMLYLDTTDSFELGRFRLTGNLIIYADEFETIFIYSSIKPKVLMGDSGEIVIFKDRRHEEER